MYADASQQGLEAFNRQPAPNEIDLISLIRDMLIKAGRGQEVINAYDNNRFIQAAVGMNSEVQRYYLNRYWNLQLVTVTATSSDERYCLIPGGTIGDWLRLFEAKVLPFIIEHNLPSNIHA